MKKHNFSAGPAILPASVLQQAAEAVRDFNGSGLSLIEISHRGKAFEAVMDEAHALVRELFGLDEQWEVAFLTGGASSQFFMVPMNLLNEDETAAYTDTGVWANRAIKEAKLFGNVEVVASSKDQNYTFLPKNFAVPSNARYLHITTNNTIYGTQWQEIPHSPVPIVADMSSDIFSRPVDVSPYGLIYAGAQKNIGPAGVTLVCVRKDMLGHVRRTLPTMLDYRTHIKDGSMYNTPPVFPIYVCMLTLRWIKEMGGLKAIGERNERKAQTLYAEIDRNPLFKGTVAAEDRSRMNVNFLTADPAHEATFLKICADNGIEGIKGHRSVGGLRASLYNALEQESVDFLVELMRGFKP
jgi:phosphoserine aminotransferase